MTSTPVGREDSVLVALLEEAIEWISDGATDSEGMDPYAYDLVERLRAALAAADNPAPDARDADPALDYRIAVCPHCGEELAVDNPAAFNARLKGIRDLAALLVAGHDGGYPLMDDTASEGELIDRLREALTPGERAALSPATTETPGSVRLHG